MEYEVTPEIKKMVTFSSFNLAQENYLSSICKNRKMDLIFCRNVLMYFTYEWAAKVSANLSNSLSEDGWLVVSSCELSSQLFPQFTSINFPGAVLYRNGNKVSTQENSTLQLFKSSAFQPSSTLLSHLKIRQPSGAVKLPKKTIEDKTSSIRLLADQGSLKEALLICNETIETYKLSPRLYFLRASILQELDESNEAIVSLRKAIYIDPDYIMGHFTLGNLFTRIGKIKNADRYFKNVLDLLSRCAKDDILPESEGLSVKHIREIVLYNMKTQLTT
jgi:chemotaxis protein methyltransferase CheR